MRPLHQSFLLLCLIALIFLSLSHPTTSQKISTPSALFVDVRSDFLNGLIDGLITIVQNETIKAVTKIDLQGTEGDVEYHAYNFVFNEFDMFPVLLNAGQNGQYIIKTTFQQEKSLYLQFDLHIKYGLLISTFELRFYNTEPGGLQIAVTPNLRSYNYPTFTASADWLFNTKTKKAFEVKTKCLSNPLCTVPIVVVELAAKTIFKSVMADIPQFILLGLDKGLTPILEKIPLNVQFDEAIELDLHGEIVPHGSGSNMDVVIALDGGFSQIGNPTPAPFSPPAVPAILSNPPGQVGFVVTDFFFETLLWSLENSGALSVELGENNLPPSIAGELNTDNSEMRLIAPGLKHYPDMNISIVVSVVNTSSAVIDFTQGGLDISGLKILLDFKLNNETEHDLEAFTIGIDAILMMDINVNASEIEIDLLSGRRQSSFDFETVDTNIGRVSVNLIQTAFMSAFRILASKPIKVPFKFPKFLQSPEVIFNEGYVSFYTNFAASEDKFVHLREAIASVYGDVLQRMFKKAFDEEFRKGFAKILAESLVQKAFRE
eukprot:TRINITY_DN13008_c0_g1_i1.p1 TRINITY_DN13008_c0_g1~~TRINITY_DN13008_c0_g1_i1.p1  ORF type:complete len:559 (+),score=217.07 TRINITY_DN13008_c0_g1_i1:41-1678(+)